MRCCFPPACSSSDSAIQASGAGERCSTGPRTTRRSRRARPSGSSFPASASSRSELRSPCSTTPSTRSETRPCGRSGACGGPVSSLLSDDQPQSSPARRRPGAILKVRELSVDYVMERGIVRAVQDVSFEVGPGEFIGIVGESGCGKSTLLFAIAQLLAPPASISSGSVTFNGDNLVGLTDRMLSAVRWLDMSVVMQSAMNALNPVKSISAQFKDALRAHGVTSKHEIANRSAEVLKMVSIDPVHLNSYPHQLSGGMRQRSMIAMALLFTPELVIMDEPTSALDVVAQRSLMVHIKKLQEELGFAVIFVTHDMSLVSHFSERLMVMYAGQVAEYGATRQVFDTPRHPYSVGLMEAFPSIRGKRVPLTGIPGRPPDLSRPQVGCWFAPRCPKVMPVCSEVNPDLYSVQDVQVRCLLYGGPAGGTARADAAAPAEEMSTGD